MWIPKVIADKRQHRNITHGVVVHNDGDETSINTVQEFKAVDKIVPYGVMYSAPIGSKSVVVPVGKSQVCAGIICNKAEELKPGELMLFSSGGAKIYLKNDGTVIINGKVFEAGGE